MAAPHETDDEALARFLQYEEQQQQQQQNSTQQQPNRGAVEDTQESRDLALARQMMEMEWKQHSQSSANVPPSMVPDPVLQQQQQQESIDFEMARRIQAQEELLSQNHHATSFQEQSSNQHANRSPSRPSETQRVPTNNINSNNSHTMAAMGALSSTTTAAANKDPPLATTAMGIPEAQAQPQDSTQTHEQPTTFESNDQRLAWLMASTGRSLRDLQSEEDLLPKVLQQKKKNKATPQSTLSSSDYYHPRRPSRTEPSSPLRSTQQTFAKQQRYQHQSSDWDDAASCSTATSKSAPTSPRAKSPLRQYQQQQAQQHFYPSHHRSSSSGATAAASSHQWTSRGTSLSPMKRQSRRPKLGGIPMGIPPPSIADTGMSGSIPAGIPPASGLPSILLTAGAGAGIPAAIPPPPPMGGRGAPKGEGCAKCGLASGTFLKAMDKVYHPECFRCFACGEKIEAMSNFYFKAAMGEGDSTGGVPASASKDNSGDSKKTLYPYHAECYTLHKAKKSPCVVCQNPIPTNAHGGMLFIKHPFFENERMCPDHVNPTDGNPTCRRCTGCRRFEPNNARFVDLGDGHRCVCFSCVRTVIMDGAGVDPLWSRLVNFFENVMNLPVSDDFRTLPVLLVGQGELHEHQTTSHCIHAQSPHLMARGLTLVDKVTKRRSSRRKVKVPTMQFNFSTSSFESSDHSSSEGYKYFYLPEQEPTTTNKVVCIMCLSGLPRDLTACILAHEATHAWLHLHPEANQKLDPQVEEGVAQLVAMLFLTQGLEKTTPPGPDDSGPTDNDLRRYFQHCIESDESEVFGLGYRKAAHAYQEVGIVALMTHVVRYGTFPEAPR